MNKRRKTILAGIVISTLGLLMLYGYFNKPPQTSTGTYKVVKVLDGDTIEIERYGKLETVRLIGIDTPETVDPRKPVQCFGLQASDNSKVLMTGKSVRIEADPLVGERDKYNRLLAYVWLDGNRLVNQLLVRDGFAHEYTYRSQSYKYQIQFKQAEAAAREAGVGLWAADTCGGNTK